MRDLEIIGRRCVEDLECIGIYPNDIKKFEINTRAKRRYGQACKHNNEYTINISIELLNDNCPYNSLLETLYHEILHCVDGCMNHGKKWSELAELVNDCYGVNITRVSSLEEKYGNEYAQEVRAQRKESYNTYKCVCSDCGKVYKRVGMRAPSWYAHPNNYFCTPCHKMGLDGKLRRVS